VSAGLREHGGGVIVNNVVELGPDRKFRPDQLRRAKGAASGGLSKRTAGSRAANYNIAGFWTLARRADPHDHADLPEAISETQVSLAGRNCPGRAYTCVSELYGDQTGRSSAVPARGACGERMMESRGWKHAG